MSVQGLKTIDLQQSNYLSVLERCVTFGHPVLLQNVQETLDPSLNPILTKSVIKQGASVCTTGCYQLRWSKFRAANKMGDWRDCW